MSAEARGDPSYSMQGTRVVPDRPVPSLTQRETGWLTLPPSTESTSACSGASIWRPTTSCTGRRGDPSQQAAPLGSAQSEAAPGANLQLSNDPKFPAKALATVKTDQSLPGPRAAVAVV